MDPNENNILPKAKENIKCINSNCILRLDINYESYMNQRDSEQ